MGCSRAIGQEDEVERLASPGFRFFSALVAFDDVPQLYIDPVEYIDRRACVPVCPVSTIFALDDRPKKWKQYAERNESYVKAGKYTQRKVRQAARQVILGLFGKFGPLPSGNVPFYLFATHCAEGPRIENKPEPACGTNG